MIDVKYSVSCGTKTLLAKYEATRQHSLQLVQDYVHALRRLNLDTCFITSDTVLADTVLYCTRFTYWLAHWLGTAGYGCVPNMNFFIGKVTQ